MAATDFSAFGIVFQVFDCTWLSRFSKMLASLVHCNQNPYNFFVSGNNRHSKGYLSLAKRGAAAPASKVKPGNVYGMFMANVYGFC